MTKRSRVLLLSLLGLVAMPIHQVSAAPATVLYQDQTTKLEQASIDGEDLWVAPADLKRVSGFELKPEGACLDQICVPVNEGKPDALVADREGKKMVNLTALARKLGQAYTVDRENAVWSLAAIPAQLGGYLQSAIAPDFALADRKGKIVHLSDFRGKKVLLITWASW